jgi:hypothetical protein
VAGRAPGHQFVLARAAAPFAPFLSPPRFRCGHPSGPVEISACSSKWAQQEVTNDGSRKDLGGGIGPGGRLLGG